MLEKFFVDVVKRLSRTFFAYLEKFRNVLHVIERPVLLHFEVDMSIAITQKEL